MSFLAFGQASTTAAARRLVCASVVCFAGITSAGLTGEFAHADERSQAKRIHDRLAGVPISNTALDDLATEVASNPVGAAFTAMDNPNFYNVTLKNFAAPWTNRESNVFVPLNDYTATVIGMVRDESDFRELLSGDIAYVGAGNLNLPAYSVSNNNHYESLETSGADLDTALTRTTQSSLSGLPSEATAGIMTTRAAAQAFFIDGTNRAMFRFTLLNHLCNDLEQVQDTTRVPDRIRQDVSRSPGGDSRVFQNTCIGCHSGMDPLAQAYAYYNYDYDEENDPEGENGRITYNAANDVDPVTGSRVHAKYFNNDTTFEFGFRTPNDAWANYWRAGANARLGWAPALPGAGSGAKSMGQELANSDAFAQCQVEKVFENVCLRVPADSLDRAQVDTMIGSFRSSGYNLKQVFAESAVYCMGE